MSTLFWIIIAIIAFFFFPKFRIFVVGILLFFVAMEYKWNFWAVAIPVLVFIFFLPEITGRNKKK